MIDSLLDIGKDKEIDLEYAEAKDLEETEDKGNAGMPSKRRTIYIRGYRRNFFAK